MARLGRSGLRQARGRTAGGRGPGLDLPAGEAEDAASRHLDRTGGAGVCRTVASLGVVRIRQTGGTAGSQRPDREIAPVRSRLCAGTEPGRRAGKRGLRPSHPRPERPGRRPHLRSAKSWKAGRGRRRLGPLVGLAGGTRPRHPPPCRQRPRPATPRTRRNPPPDRSTPGAGRLRPIGRTRSRERGRPGMGRGTGDPGFGLSRGSQVLHADRPSARSGEGWRCGMASEKWLGRRSGRSR